MSLVDHELAQRVIARALLARRRPGRALRRGSARLLALARRRAHRAAAGRLASAAPRCGSCAARPATSATWTVCARRRCWRVAGLGGRGRARRRARARGHSARPSRRPGTRCASGPRTSTPSARPSCCGPATSAPARPATRSRQVTAGYVEGRRIVEVFNSDGVAAADDRTRVRLSTQVVARRDGRVETGTDTRGGHAGFELLEQDPEAVAESAARKALTAAGRRGRAHRPPAGGGRQRLRRRAAARGRRPRPGGRRRAEAGQRLRRAGSATQLADARRDRLRRRAPRGTSGAATASTTRARPPSRTTVIEDGELDVVPLRPDQGARRTAWTPPATAAASPSATCPSRG